jgi:hypothetical protein
MKSIDLTNLDFGTAMRVVAADLDQSILIALKRCELDLGEQGANADQIAILIEFQRDRLQIWRAEFLAEMNEWLSESERGLLH